VHVPHKASGEARNAVIGGHVQMMFDAITTTAPTVQGGQVRALGTTGKTRSKLMPDVPTIAEAGVPGYESGVWFGIMVPAGTPRDIVMKLNAAAVQATKAPEFIKRMTDLGYNIIPGSPEDMARMLKAELARWAPIVKASGAKID
jgi:tripartite-type tricarboxylate transporter receptor subunit TctC